MYRFFQNHNFNSEHFFLYNPVNLRQYRPSSEIGNQQLGYCVGVLITIFQNWLDNPNDDAEVRSKFWSLVRKHALEFDDRVKNDNIKFHNPEFREFDENEMAIHVGLSNIGILSSDYFNDDDNDDCFKIENVYFICDFAQQLDKLFGTIYLNTVGKKIFCCFCSNNFFFNPKFNDEIIEILKLIFELVGF